MELKPDRFKQFFRMKSFLSSMTRLRMKVGLKFFPDTLEKSFPDIDRIREAADFLEIMAVEGYDFSRFEGLGIPVNVHAEHSEFGVNLANPKKRDANLRALRFAQGVADMFKSKIIVVHSGLMENIYCYAGQVVKVLNQLGDKRVVLENQIPKKREGKKYLCSTPQEVAELMERTGLSFCLDFSHAQMAAAHAGINYMEMFRKFMELEPKYFHLCDGIVGRKEDMHLHLGEGNFPLDEIKKLLPRGARVCLEVPPDLEGKLKDVGVWRSL